MEVGDQKEEHELPFYRSLAAWTWIIGLSCQLFMIAAFSIYTRHVARNRSMYFEKWKDYLSSDAFEKMLDSAKSSLVYFIPKELAHASIAMLFLVFRSRLYKYSFSGSRFANLTFFGLNLAVLLVSGNKMIKCFNDLWDSPYIYTTLIPFAIYVIIIYKTPNFYRRVNPGILALLFLTVYMKFINSFVLVPNSKVFGKDIIGIDDLRCVDAATVKDGIRQLCSEFDFPEENVVIDPHIEGAACFRAWKLPKIYVCVPLHVIEGFGPEGTFAVLLHELGHAKNRSRLKRGLFSMLEGIVPVGVYLFFSVKQKIARGNTTIYPASLYSCSVLIPLIMNLLHSHRDEIAADDLAAHHGYGTALARYLIEQLQHTKLHNFDSPWWINMYFIHPNILSRIRRISE